jgi:hypothetical protein
MDEVSKMMAENGGFEPPIELSPYNGLANRRLQPLGQLSVLCCGEHEGVMPGFGNYSLRVGAEDKVLQNAMVDLPWEGR